MATIPNPAAAVAGGLATAAQFNAVRDAVTLLLDPPHMIARAAGAQSIPNAAFTGISMQTEVEDNDAMFTPGASTITIRTPGRWLLTAQLPWVFNGTGGRLLGFMLNGVEVHRQRVQPDVNAGGTTDIATSHVQRCALNDVVTLVAYQNSGAALTTGYSPGTGAIAMMTASWIGR